jgi:hypothetical protein
MLGILKVHLLSSILSGKNIRCPTNQKARPTYSPIDIFGKLNKVSLSHEDSSVKISS